MKDHKSVIDALEDVDWYKAMEEEIEQIEKTKTWSLVSRPEGIGTKWVFIDENGEVTRNKARSVCNGYAQEEGVDYGETLSLVARLEGVIILLAYSTYKGFKVIKWILNLHF